MSSNKKIKEELIRRYGAECFIEKLKLRNNILFENENIDNFYQAILYYIAGMTDHFAMEMYQEIIGF